MKINFYILIGAVSVIATGCVKRESAPMVIAVGSSPASPQVVVRSAPDSTPDLHAKAGPALTDFSCELLATDIPAELKVGAAPVVLHVKVTNKSKQNWSALLPDRGAFNATNLAYRWYSGKSVYKEGGRALLKSDLAPGESAAVELQVEVPKDPGNYRLQVEPVQEAVAWFSDKGGCKQEAEVKIAR
jgi:hypothetical protein